MVENSGQSRRRSRRRATSAQGPAPTPAPATAPASTPAPADPPARPIPSGAPRRRPSGEGGERGLRDLVGAGRSQLGVSGALRGRDVNRPSEDDLADAERETVIVRRNWRPDVGGQ